MVGADGGVFVFGAMPFAGSVAGRTGGVAAVDIAVRRAATATGSCSPTDASSRSAQRPPSAAPRGSRPRRPRSRRRPTAPATCHVGRRRRVRVRQRAVPRIGRGRARSNGPIVDAAIDGVAATATGCSGRDGGVFGFPGPGLPPGGTPHLTSTPVAHRAEHPVGPRIPPRRIAALHRTRRDAAGAGQRRSRAARRAERRARRRRGRDARPRGRSRLREQPARLHVLQHDRRRREGRRLDARRRGHDRDAVGTLVAGLPENPSGRHSGCRPRVGPDGFLWIGTGDAATGTNPQDVNSLGGKVLRVDRFSGAAAPGNPFGLRWYTRRPPQRAGPRVPARHRRAVLGRARHRPRRRGQPARRGRELRLEPGAGLRREQADDVRGRHPRDLEQRLPDDRDVRRRRSSTDRSGATGTAGS